MPKAKSAGLTVLGGRGFQINFPNGCCASIMFGPGNYCERREMMGGWAGNKDSHESPDAEVAAFDREGHWLLDEKDHGDNVVGHVGPEKVAAFIQAVANHRIGEKFVFDFGDR